MDRYCIDQGVLFDNPTVDTLVNPTVHSAKCLLDPPPCLHSPWEILGDPDMADMLYSRSVSVEDADSKDKLVKMVQGAGKDCANGCAGNQTTGIRGYVYGKLLDVGRGGIPPRVDVLHAVASTGPGDAGCHLTDLDALLPNVPLQVGDEVCVEGFGTFLVSVCGCGCGSLSYWFEGFFLTGCHLFRPCSHG